MYLHVCSLRLMLTTESWLCLPQYSDSLKIESFTLVNKYIIFSINSACQLLIITLENHVQILF
ncbi:hypothetical protein BGI33_08675 [Snodgrassella alvi]|nr:hypothetical protein BGI33_08675 [Snodgrassella alvi]PIT16065.1 hypothetical protein BGI34_09955 [Snodgrassella alvi]